MKRVIPLLFMFAYCITDCRAQITLSPRVGEVIDSSERTYLCLFPNIDGYVSAKLVQRADSMVDVVVSRNRKSYASDTVFSIRAESIGELKKWIENFEVDQHDDKLVRWNLLGGLIDLAAVNTREELPSGYITVESPEGSAVHGKLLLADDSTLTIWRSTQPYYWQQTQSTTEIVVIPARAIELFQFDTLGNGFWAGAKDGALGGAIGCGIWGALVGSISFGGPNSDHSVDWGDVTTFGAVGALGGGIVGGVFGGIFGSFGQHWVHGQEDEYQFELPQLKKHAVFTTRLPPEFSHHGN